jgi:hypothetical protein
LSGDSIQKVAGIPPDQLDECRDAQCPPDVVDVDDEDSDARDHQYIGGHGGVRSGSHARGHGHAPDSRPRSDAVVVPVPAPTRPLSIRLKKMSTTATIPTRMAMIRMSSGDSVAPRGYIEDVAGSLSLLPPERDCRL